VALALPVLGFEALGQTKVTEDALLSLWVEEKVGWLDVPMHDVCGVGCAQCVEEAAEIVAE
jgi:hypothetical protein